MNGTDQVAAYAQLLQPDSLAGFRVGDLADCPTLGRVEILELCPPFGLQVRTQSGGKAEVNWRALQRVEVRQ